MREKEFIFQHKYCRLWLDIGLAEFPAKSLDKLTNMICFTYAINSLKKYANDSEVFSNKMHNLYTISSHKIRLALCAQ